LDDVEQAFHGKLDEISPFDSFSYADWSFLPVEYLYHFLQT
jgi:hypothetical protein